MDRPGLLETRSDDMADQKAECKKRFDRVMDAVHLKETDRVPIIPVTQYYPYLYGGGTISKCMYDWEYAGACMDKYYEDFKPDLGWDPVHMYPGQYLEACGLKWFRWPGGALEGNAPYQYIEGDYMLEDEYKEAARDMTKFMMNKWIPRCFEHLGGFKKLGFRNSMWFSHMGTLAAFGDPEVEKSLMAAIKAGKILRDWYAYLAEYGQKMENVFGVPVAYAAWAFAPYDMIADTLRGTLGMCYDIIERKEEILELIDAITDFAIEDTISGAKAAGRPWVWFWLHRGTDEFMSEKTYGELYWPSLRKYIIALVDAGLVPMVYVEGAYNNRLQFLADVPKGKVVYSFEKIDMEKAKKVLGGTACIAGNLPNAMLAYGSKEEVVNYCKWLIDTCAPGGGYMFDTGALIDEAKQENMEAMFDTVQTYGKR